MRTWVRVHFQKPFLKEMSLIWDSFENECIYTDEWDERMNAWIRGKCGHGRAIKTVDILNFDESFLHSYFAYQVLLPLRYDAPWCIATA